MIAYEIAPYRRACVGTGLLWPDDWERLQSYHTPNMVNITRRTIEFPYSHPNILPKRVIF